MNKRRLKKAIKKWDILGKWDGEDESTMPMVATSYNELLAVYRMKIKKLTKEVIRYGSI